MAHEKLGELNRIQYNLKQNGDLRSNGKDPDILLTKELETRLENILSNCDRLDMLVTKEPAQGARRANAKVRVDQLKTDVRGIQSSYASIQARRYQRDQELRDRNSLLSMSFTTNAEAAKENGMSAVNGRDNSDSTSILIDRAIAQNDALGRSNRAVDDMLSQGSTMLGKYECVNAEIF